MRVIITEDVFRQGKDAGFKYSQDAYCYCIGTAMRLVYFEYECDSEDEAYNKHSEVMKKYNAP